MPLVAPLLLLLAVAIWAGVFLRYGSVLLLALAILVAGTVFGPAFYAVEGPFQISSERVLFAALVPLFFIHRWAGRSDPKPLSRGDWLVLGLTGYLACSSLIGGSNSASGNTIARWLFYVALPCGMYFAARGSRITERDLRWLCNGFLGLGIYLAVIAWLEGFGLHSLILPRYIANPEYWEFFGRARGPLLNPAANGILLTAALGVSVTRWLDAGRFGRLAYAAATLLLLGACYFTLTRCVWLGAATAIGWIIFLRLPTRWRIWSLACVVICGGLLATTLGEDLLKLKRDEQLSASASLESIKLRPMLAAIAWEMFQDQPLVGHGFGHYLDHNGPYAEAHAWEMPLRTATSYVQHNVVLSMLVDTGVIGTCLYLATLAWWCLLAWKLQRHSNNDPTLKTFAGLTMAIGLAYWINGMFQDATIFPMIHMFLWTIGGLLVGLAVRGYQTVGVVTSHVYEPRDRGAAQHKSQGHDGYPHRDHATTSLSSWANVLGPNGLGPNAIGPSRAKPPGQPR